MFIFWNINYNLLIFCAVHVHVRSYLCHHPLTVMFALWISLIFLFLQLRYTDTLFTEQEVRYSLQWKCILGDLCVNWIKQSVQIYCNIYYFSFQRGLSIKSVPVSLVLPDTKGKSFLVNVFDTPGKIMDSSIAIYCKTEYRIIWYYYMPCVCRQYNACSDWLIVIELQGTILP